MFSHELLCGNGLEAKAVAFSILVQFQGPINQKPVQVQVGCAIGSLYCRYRLQNLSSITEKPGQVETPFSKQVV